jgi:hypothetical protein
MILNYHREETMKSVNQGLIAFALIACVSFGAQAQSFFNVPIIPEGGFGVGGGTFSPPTAQLTDLVAIVCPVLLTMVERVQPCR